MVFNDPQSSCHFKRNVLPTAEVRSKGNGVYLLDFSSLTSEYMVSEMGRWEQAIHKLN